MEESKKREVEKRGIFNEDGDLDLAKRKIIQGNTTNLNDFNNLKYTWTVIGTAKLWITSGYQKKLT